MSRRSLTSGFSTHRLSQLLSALALAFLLLPHFMCAQGSSSERVYQKPQVAVHAALQQLHSSIGGRLPVLDGFVDTDQPLENYSRGYYQCSVQMTSSRSGSTQVRVTAKITAWYAGSGSTPGGYRVLPSNGRLEGDFLDRLNEALEGTASAQTSSAAPNGSVPTSTAQTGTAPTPPSVAPEPEDSGPPNSKPAMLDTAPPVSMTGGGVIPPYNPATSAYSSSASEDLLSPREKLEEAEQRKDLIADIQSLEEIRQNQIHPSNLAVVKHAGTPVQSMPAPSSSTIFEADAGDEFEILDEQENWVHVRIAGQSRGWIKTASLDLPVVAESSRSIGNLNRSETTAFRVSRQQTGTFSGKWEALQGKTVRIIWVEPDSESATSTAKEKRTFAMSVFSKAYQELASANQPVAGVVVIFDSADGGQISATLSTLQLWQAGSLSEASFLKRCALDPSDLLQVSSKTSGGNL